MFPYRSTMSRFLITLSLFWGARDSISIGLALSLPLPMVRLTATTTTTSKNAGNYGTPSPKPGSPIAPIVPTSTTPSVAPISEPVMKPEPKKTGLESSSTQYKTPSMVSPGIQPPVLSVEKPESQSIPTDSAVNQPTTAGSQETVDSSSDGKAVIQPDNNGYLNGGKSPDNSQTDQSSSETRYISGLSPEHYTSGGSSYGDTKSTPVAVVYAGTAITPDTSSHYSFPGIGNLSPDGSPITTNNKVYSLAPSATVLVSNGLSVSLSTFAAASISASATPSGSTYAANVNPSPHIAVIPGPTAAPPSSPAITVSNSPISISLAPDASIVVIGDSTQSLRPSAAKTPTAYPELTFAGSTYTANAGSAFLIQGHTILPGSSALTISGTPISFPPGGTIIVIAGQTQTLSSYYTPPPIKSRWYSR